MKIDTTPHKLRLGDTIRITVENHYNETIAVLTKAKRSMFDDTTLALGTEYTLGIGMIWVTEDGEVLNQKELEQRVLRVR